MPKQNFKPNPNFEREIKADPQFARGIAKAVGAPDPSPADRAQSRGDARARIDALADQMLAQLAPGTEMVAVALVANVQDAKGRPATIAVEDPDPNGGT